MSTIVSIDFETRSATDIKLGVERYSKDPECDVLTLSYRFPGHEIFRWNKLSAGALHALLDHVANGGLIRGWNVMFEWHIWNNVCVPKYGWPELKLEQCIDTMAQAAAQNLPQALGKCAEVLGLPSDQQKNKRGRYLISRLCVPHKPTKSRPGKWVEDEALFEELVAYCDQDVVVEETIAKKLRPLTEWEQQVWLTTQRINLRGVPVALHEVRNITRVVEAEKERLNRELRQITQRKVLKASDRNGLLAWVNERQGEAIDFIDAPDEDDLMENLAGDTVEAVLNRDDLKPEVRRALEIRQKVCQTSTAKFEKLLKITADDSTIKNLLVYHGAGTGRWASRGGFNAQNIARPLLKDADIATAHEVLGYQHHESALLLWGDKVMDAAVSCLRGVLAAPAGHEFIDADYSSVENRVGVWLADQDDKVEMFAKGLDEYKVFASRSLYNIPYEAVTKDQRQMSKSAVLGCFAADTEVLTDRGFVPISEVRLSDKVWDGLEFVRHCGVAYQGWQEVIDLAGVRVTPDHLILQEDGWARADAVDLRSAVRSVEAEPPGVDDAHCKPLPSISVSGAHTYDIVNCGPRHRFAIWTNAGLVIAHNCLFGQGANGLIEYAKGYGVTLTPERSQEVVSAYRAEYAKVRALWYACGDAAIEATNSPGLWVSAGSKLSLIHHKGFLWMKLPSGRLISWFKPVVEMQDAPWKETVNGVEQQARRPVVTVESIDTYTRQFCRHKLIGSSIFQSAVQGTARDVLANGLINVEAGGYPAVLLVHDEILALVREGQGDPEEFGSLMCKPAPWFADLPLAYEAWRGKRFRK